MREAGEPSTDVVVSVGMLCASHRGSHGRTTNAPAQRFNVANLRATLEVG